MNSALTCDFLSSSQAALMAASLDGYSLHVFTGGRTFSFEMCNFQDSVAMRFLAEGISVCFPCASQVHFLGSKLADKM
jgi:hypothetical protein